MATLGNMAGPAAFVGNTTKVSRANYTHIGFAQGIWVGGPTSWLSDGALGRHMTVGLIKVTSDGNPSQPCLGLTQPGMWRFRWSITSGPHTIAVNCKQVTNGSPRPTIVVKKNPSIGVGADVTGTAPSSAGWVTIGPVTVTATSTGVVWVELWNNLYAQYDTALFDHVVTT